MKYRPINILCLIGLHENVKSYWKYSKGHRVQKIPRNEEQTFETSLKTFIVLAPVRKPTFFHKICTLTSDLKLSVPKLDCLYSSIDNVIRKHEHKLHESNFTYLMLI